MHQMGGPNDYRVVGRTHGSVRCLRRFRIAITVTTAVALAVASVFGVACYCRKLQQRRLIAEITGGGGEVAFDYQYDLKGRWLRDLKSESVAPDELPVALSGFGAATTIGATGMAGCLMHTHRAGLVSAHFRR